MRVLCNFIAKKRNIREEKVSLIRYSKKLFIFKGSTYISFKRHIKLASFMSYKSRAFESCLPGFYVCCLQQLPISNIKRATSERLNNFENERFC